MYALAVTGSVTLMMLTAPSLTLLASGLAPTAELAASPLPSVNVTFINAALFSVGRIVNLSSVAGAPDTSLNSKPKPVL